MQFDHTEGKVSDINRLMWRASIARVKQEMQSCELVCANCHAIRTYCRQHNITDTLLEGQSDEVSRA